VALEPEKEPYGDSLQTEELLERIERGDLAALQDLICLHRAYLRRLVDLRMEAELRTRVDPSDIVQETQLVVTRRIDDFLQRRPTSFRIWLRRKALEQIVNQRRRHLRAAKRTVRREIRLSDASSIALAASVLGGTPSKVMADRELTAAIRETINQMKEADRNILLLRHVEELSNAEAAELLNIHPDAARKRHGRAFRRLCELLGEAGILARVGSIPPPEHHW
jgi:RNA polymerase sigma-70 factor (ECF subfamily)